MRYPGFHPLMNDRSGKERFNEAIGRIAGWFRSMYVTRTGFPTYEVNGDTGQPLGSRDLLAELDDYLPFFWMAGETEYVREQLGLLNERLSESFSLFNRPQIRRHVGIGLPGPLRRFVPYADVQDFVEILYGLLELHGLSPELDVLLPARELFRHIARNFSSNGRLHTFRLMPFGPVLPIMDAMTGMYIEIGVELFEQTGEHWYLETVSRWCRTWLDTDLYRTFGFFASTQFTGVWKLVPMLRRYTRRVELAKANTSMAFGLIALARMKETAGWALPALDRWLTGIRSCFMTDDGVFTHFPRLDAAPVYLPVLSTNFALIDIFCDVAHAFDRPEYLESARRIADFFLKHQSPETGLFPDEIGCRRSYLDANTDLAVALYRLTELTKEAEYREAGLRALDGILRFHEAPFGYYRDVDQHTGTPLCSLVETRFVSLFLKALLLYRDRPELYSGHDAWARYRDR